MSYTYLQEQGEESSVDNFKDIPAYVLSRLNLTQDKSYCNGSETESCQNSQYGMISEHSMEHLGEEKSTSFAEDFLAKTFPQLEKELESRANALGFGERWPGWLAKYDQDLSLWKTPQCSLLEDYIEFSETWPKWGMMRDGVCWELTTSVRHIEERESGYWPTPNTLEGLKPKTIESIQEYNRKARPGRSYCNMNLREIVVYGKQPIRMIPTPTSQEAGIIPLETKDGKPVKPGQRAYNPKTGKHTQVTLNRAVNLWPTPRSRDWKDGDSVPPSRQKNPGLATLEQQVAINNANKQSYPTPSCADGDIRALNCYKIVKGQNHLQQIIYQKEALEPKSGQLNPDWVEWLMGWPIGWTKTEPIKLDWRNWVVDPADTGEVPRVSQSITNRVHRLKAIGNGQVPLVAATAWNVLIDGLPGEREGRIGKGLL